MNKSFQINHKNKNNNIMNRTFDHQNKDSFLLNSENRESSNLFNNKDFKSETISIFGKYNLIDRNNEVIKNPRIIKQPKFELENIYRERLFSLYKNNSKEDLLNCFIESEINNILLRKQIEKEKLDKVILENKMLDIQQENIVLKNKLSHLLERNSNNENLSDNDNNKNDADNDLSLQNNSFIQKELNIENEYNNLDIDALLIKKDNEQKN